MTYLGTVLKKMSIEVILSSAETRTKESVEIIAQELSLPVVCLDELQGRKWGDFAGKHWDEVSKILDAKTLGERYAFTPPRGESAEQFESRMLAVIRKIHQKYAGKNVCIVSHGSSIRVLLPKAFGVPFEESLKAYPEYGSVSTVEYDGQNFTSPTFNRLYT